METWEEVKIQVSCNVEGTTILQNSGNSLPADMA
jgi:hypothetical protein